jgi:AraC family transcriptional regulator
MEPHKTMSTALRIVHGRFGRVALLDMDRSLVRHAHPHCHVLIKVDGADTQFSVGRDLIALNDRQAVLVNAWEAHAYVHIPEHPHTVILALYIEPEWLKNLRPNWIAGSAPDFFERPAGEVSPHIRRCAMDLAEAMMAEPEAHAAQQQLLGDLMIAVIERFTAWRTLSPSLHEIDRGNGVDWRVQRMLRQIRLDPDVGRDVNSLAKECGLSRAHFYRLFERSTRMTPHVYINVLRTEMAVRSVVQTAESLSALGERLGFSAQGHFTRFFRDHTGVNPSEFRQVARIGLMQGA